MIDEKKHTYPITIETAMINEHGNLTPAAYQRIVSTAVDAHLKKYDMDAPALIERYGVSWVLLSMTFDIKREIKDTENLYVKTWHSQSSKLFYRRDLAVYDENDEIAVAAATFSTIIDIKKRRLCTDPNIHNSFDLSGGELLIDAVPKIRLHDEVITEVEKLSVRPSWIDALGHVNNNRYGDFIYDTLSEQKRDSLNLLKRIEFYFISELKYGDSFELGRLENEKTALITAKKPGENNPSFISKLYFN